MNVENGVDRFGKIEDWTLLPMMSWHTPSLSGLGGESAKIRALLNASYIVTSIDRTFKSSNESEVENLVLYN